MAEPIPIKSREQLPGPFNLPNQNQEGEPRTSVRYLNLPNRGGKPPEPRMVH